MSKRQAYFDEKTDLDLKKAKIDQIFIESQLYTYSLDRQEYFRLFAIIYSSKMIQMMNINKYLIKLVTEFTMGCWIDCYNCSEGVSFLRIDVENECMGCGENVCIHYCDIHKEICTMDHKIGRVRCCECYKRICMELKKECIICNETYCLYCLDSDLCDNCNEDCMSECLNIDIIKHDYFD